MIVFYRGLTDHIAFITQIIDENEGALFDMGNMLLLPNKKLAIVKKGLRIPQTLIEDKSKIEIELKDFELEKSLVDSLKAYSGAGWNILHCIPPCRNVFEINKFIKFAVANEFNLGFKVITSSETPKELLKNGIADYLLGSITKFYNAEFELIIKMKERKIPIECVGQKDAHVLVKEWLNL